MTSNIIPFKTSATPAPTAAAHSPFDAIVSMVRAVIGRQRLAATRRMTRRQLQTLPTVVRRDVGLTDVRDHQEY
ncbi:hypothetical protein LRX75_13025 [Rhizobium sp. DKSPLA3]|uniref:DUF1127 domain-containing protein n=1 Tax=Rhizobium quercicola TaxID=2901226 RepID=A0A9X1T0X7_9HYPH|nr:hypothetical protein [Rhizobium quercicola]MCD7109961.1 hypothetical protein [Rhizobium quercicola]